MDFVNSLKKSTRKIASAYDGEVSMLIDDAAVVVKNMRK
jgi:hypothetical protein